MIKGFFADIRTIRNAMLNRKVKYRSTKNALAVALQDGDMVSAVSYKSELRKTLITQSFITLMWVLAAVILVFGF